MTPTICHPAWADLGDHLLNRLASKSALFRDWGDDELPPLEEDDLPKGSSPLLRELTKTAGGAHHSPEAAEALIAQGRDPAATDAEGNSRPQHHLLTSDLALMFRLAATLVSKERAQDLLSPGALTVLQGFSNTETACLAKLISAGLMPVGWKAAPNMRLADDEDCLLLVYPDGDDEEISQHSRRNFLRHAAEALDARAPVLTLIPNGLHVPQEIQAALPKPLTLQPLTREIMLAHLRASHSATGAIDETATAAALPDDEALSRLSLAELRAALRVETAAQAAANLAKFSTQPKRGPMLDDLSGSGPALQAARQLVRDLQSWGAGAVPWSEMTRSALLFGEPGTGKSYLCRAMGNTPGISFVEGSFGQWQAQGHLGHMLAAMSKCFAEAKQKRPAVLFIDEIDSAGSRSDGDRHTINYRRQVVNEFLRQVDLLNAEEGVLLIGACNQLDALDPAILRAGRFDLKIEVQKPGAADIHAMLQAQLGDSFPEDILRGLARKSVGRTPAEIDAAIREARSAARFRNRNMTFEDLATHLPVTGEQYVDLEWRIALHECGHAIAAWGFGIGDVQRIALLPVGGEIVTTPARNEMRLENLMAELSYTLAGRAAEALVLGEASGGSGGSEESDLSRATRIALAIDARLGLGSLGPIWAGDLEDSLLLNPTIQSRIRSRLRDAEKRASDLLDANRPLLLEMAKVLLRERLISGGQLESWKENARSKNKFTAVPKVCTGLEAG